VEKKTKGRVEQPGKHHGHCIHGVTGSGTVLRVGGGKSDHPGEASKGGPGERKYVFGQRKTGGEFV